MWPTGWEPLYQRITRRFLLLGISSWFCLCLKGLNILSVLKSEQLCVIFLYQDLFLSILSILMYDGEDIHFCTYVSEECRIPNCCQWPTRVHLYKQCCENSWCRVLDVSNPGMQDLCILEPCPMCQMRAHSLWSDWEIASMMLYICRVPPPRKYFKTFRRLSLTYLFLCVE